MEFEEIIDEIQIMDIINHIPPGNKESDCQSCGNSVVGDVFILVYGKPLCWKCV